MTRTLCTLLYQPRERDIDRVCDILERTPHEDAIVVDQSPTPNRCGLVGYFWRDGYNEGYGGGINAAVKRALGDLFVYFSSSRSTLNDATWIDDITAPLSDPRCGLAGTVGPCNYASIARRPCDIFEPQIHVQGGVFAARTATLRDHPFSPYFPQVFSDVYLSRSVTRSGMYLQDVRTISSVADGFAKTDAKFTVDYQECAKLDELFARVSAEETPINEHLGTLQHFAARSNRVVEFGVEYGKSTVALLAGRPRWMRSYDNCQCDVSIPSLEETDWRFIQADSREVDLPVVDLLFIDTDHTYEHLRAELERHHGRVTRWIIVHDTVEFPQMARALWHFARNSDFRILQHKTNNNGLTILERTAGYPT